MRSYVDLRQSTLTGVCHSLLGHDATKYLARKMQNIADLVIGILKDGSVKRVYGLPGDSLNGFTDALRRDGTIAW